MTNNPPELKWLAVDLDLTLANTSGAPDYHLLEPIEDNVRKLRECVDEGWKIVIHTSRHWQDYSLIEDWLNKHQIPFKFICCGKILVHRYIDDKAIPADAEWKDYL